MLVVQDVPSQEERMFKDKTAVRKDTPIKGVRMGAGERSYLVRDNQIDVLKNMYGGVQVSATYHLHIFLSPVLQSLYATCLPVPTVEEALHGIHDREFI